MIVKALTVAGFGVALAARRHFDRDNIARTFRAGYRYGAGAPSRSVVDNRGRTVVSGGC